MIELFAKSHCSRLQISYSERGSLSVEHCGDTTASSAVLAKLRSLIAGLRSNGCLVDENVYAALANGSLDANPTACALAGFLREHSAFVFRSQHLCYFAVEVECSVSGNGRLREVDVKMYQCFHTSEYGRSEILQSNESLITVKLDTSDETLRSVLLKECTRELHQVWPNTEGTLC